MPPEAALGMRQIQASLRAGASVTFTIGSLENISSSVRPLSFWRLQAHRITSSAPKLVVHLQIALDNPASLHLDVISRAIRVWVVTNADRTAYYIEVETGW